MWTIGWIIVGVIIAVIVMTIWHEIIKPSMERSKMRDKRITSFVEDIRTIRGSQSVHRTELNNIQIGAKKLREDTDKNRNATIVLGDRYTDTSIKQSNQMQDINTSLDNWAEYSVNDHNKLYDLIKLVEEHRSYHTGKIDELARAINKLKKG